MVSRPARFQIASRSFLSPEAMSSRFGGLIYLGLMAFAIYQALPAQRNNERLRRVGYWFALSCLANAAWIFLWHYNLFSLSLVVMLLLLACLVMIYLRLGIGRISVGAPEKWTVNAPFSVYLGLDHRGDRRQRNRCAL